MSEWKGYRLGEIATPVRDKIETSCLSSSSYISTENMLPNKAGVTLSSGIPSGNAVKFKKEDILILNIRPYFKKNWRADKIGECSADVMCLRALECVDPTFLYYLLSQDMFFNYVMQGSKGTKMPRGDRNQIMQWPVKIPCFDTQRYIASFLSSLDDKIAVNKKICENLEAQALFKHWFVDFAPFKDGNFCANREQNETCFNSAEVQPKITGKACKFVESELGSIPEGWRVGTLGDLGEIVGGATPSKAESSYFTDKGIPWLTPKDLSNDLKKITSRGEIDITEDGYKSCSAKIMPRGSVLFSSRAPIGYLTIAKNSICTNQGFKSVVPKYAGTAYIYYLLKLNTKRIESMSTGTTFKEASGALMKSLAVVLPSKSILDAFESKVLDIFNEQEILETESSCLSTLRDTLLPKLMSGEIKV